MLLRGETGQNTTALIELVQVQRAHGKTPRPLRLMGHLKRLHHRFRLKLSVWLCRNSFSSLVHFYLRKKKTFTLKPRKTCNKTLSFQELVARTAAGGLFAVFRVLFSFVVCKVRDVSQTPQMKLPASLRRLKNLLITNFVLFH